MSIQNGVVQDYLNCGLDSFGLKINGTIHNNSCQSLSENQNESIFSDEDANDDHEDVYVFAHGGQDLDTSQQQKQDE